MRHPTSRAAGWRRRIVIILVSITLTAAVGVLAFVVQTSAQLGKLTTDVSFAQARASNLSNAQREALRLVQALTPSGDLLDTDAVALQSGLFVRQVVVSSDYFPDGSPEARRLDLIATKVDGFPWGRLDGTGRRRERARRTGMALVVQSEKTVKGLYDLQERIFFHASHQSLEANHRSQTALGELVALVLVLGVVWAVILRRRASHDVASSYAALLKEMEVSRALQHDLTHQAGHDPLTGLANRARMQGLIEAALHRGQRAEAIVGVLFIDLDHFKMVNDTLGHRAGDEVLRTTAERMRSLVRAGDTVGRLGGDEFVALIEPVSNAAELVDLADRLITALSAPIPIGGRSVMIGASIGAAVNLDRKTNGSKLLDHADIAAYRAKAAGRGRTVFFDAALGRELEERAYLEAAIRVGLASGEFQLYYQPLVELSSGDVRGYEALIRWRRPGHGLVPPDSFIPIAEQSDLICDIDRWVLREASHQLADWTRSGTAGAADCTIAVNISGRHVAGSTIVPDVIEALQRAAVPATRLVLEITETVLVDLPKAALQLSALRELGVAISIDDFGTGYTSIGQLRHLHVDILKIDRSFIASSAPGAPELVALMINAAHALGLQVVAEGIEHLDQLTQMQHLGCDSAQGYYFERPKPPEAITMGPGRPPLPAAIQRRRERARSNGTATSDANLGSVPSGTPVDPGLPESA